MTDKKVFRFSLVYFGILTMHVLDVNLEIGLEYLTKPLILISLLIFFIGNSPHLQKHTRNTMVMALLFSLIGDVLLLMVNKSPHYFTMGLVTFLLAHIMYITIFSKRQNPQIKVYIFAILLTLYAGVLFYFIKNSLGDLMIPVILYVLIILVMAITAFKRKGRVPVWSYYLVLIGALCFLMSDSILALNKFHKPFLYPQVSIMLTYGLAQFLITLGILKQEH